MYRAVPLLILATLLVAPAPASPVDDWAADLPVSFGFLLEVTFMKIDVADLEVRLDGASADAVAAIRAEGKHDDARRDRVVALLHAADPVAYGMTFRRDASQSKFLKGIRKNLENARKAGELTEEERARVETDVLEILAPHAERGGRKGDRLLFRVDGDAARLVYVGVDGDVLADRAYLDGPHAKAFRCIHTGKKSKLRKKFGESPWR